MFTGYVLELTGYPVFSDIRSVHDILINIRLCKGLDSYSWKVRKYGQSDIHILVTIHKDEMKQNIIQFHSRIFCTCASSYEKSSKVLSH